MLYFENKQIDTDVSRLGLEGYFYHPNSPIEQLYSDALAKFLSQLDPFALKRLYSNTKNEQGPNFDFRQTIALDFKVHSQFLYGLPERADRTLL